MILALDVGFANTGWVIFQDGAPIDCGCIKTKKNSTGLPKSKFKVTDDNVLRSQHLASELVQIIDKHKPDAIVGELPTGGGQSAAAITQMAMSVAIIAVLVMFKKIPHCWSTPIAGKKAMTGLRGAEKDDMMNACREKFPNYDWPKVKNRFEHIADAVASYLALHDHELVAAYG